MFIKPANPGQWSDQSPFAHSPTPSGQHQRWPGRDSRRQCWFCPQCWMSVLNWVVGELPLLAGRPGFGHLGHGKCERFVVHKRCELPALQQWTKVPHSEVQSEELPFKSAVLLFAGASLPAEEAGSDAATKRGATYLLFVHRANGIVRPVHGPHTMRASYNGCISWAALGMKRW